MVRRVKRRHTTSLLITTNGDFTSYYEYNQRILGKRTEILYARKINAPRIFSLNFSSIISISKQGKRRAKPNEKQRKTITNNFLYLYKIVPFVILNAKYFISFPYWQIFMYLCFAIIVLMGSHLYMFYHVNSVCIVSLFLRSIVQIYIESEHTFVALHIKSLGRILLFACCFCFSLLLFLFLFLVEENKLSKERSYFYASPCKSRYKLIKKRAVVNESQLQMTFHSR